MLFLRLIPNNLFVVQGNFNGDTGINVKLSTRPFGAQPTTVKEMPNKVLQERPCAA